MQKYLEDYKKKYIDKKIQDAQMKLQKNWNDINLSVHKSLAVYDPNFSKQQSLSGLSVADQNNDSGNMAVGIILGGLALAAFHPFIALGAVVFGGKNFLSFFSERNKQNFLTNVKMQIDKRYGEIIPAQVQKFKIEYRKNTQDTLATIEKIVNSKLSGLEEQFKQMIDEKNKEDTDVAKERIRLNDYKNNLQKLKSSLSEAM